MKADFQHLLLDGNSIGKAAMSAVVKCVVKKQRLQKLSLNANNFGTGVDELQKMLENAHKDACLMGLRYLHILRKSFGRTSNSLSCLFQKFPLVITIHSGCTHISYLLTVGLKSTAQILIREFIT